VVFRENTEGIYVGIGGQFKRGTPDEVAINEDVNTRKGVERLIRAAFDYAKSHGKKTVHHERQVQRHEARARALAPVLLRGRRRSTRASRPSTSTWTRSASTWCRRPSPFEVIVTNNLFGDIVTDLGAALQGGLGMAASANVHAADRERVAMFEPVHGSAPPLAGKDKANPLATVLTVGMMLDPPRRTRRRRPASRPS
jgi:3-isopropylmalate dehydrogenase